MKKTLVIALMILLVSLSCSAVAAQAENSPEIIELIANGPFSRVVDTEDRMIWNLASDNESGIASIEFDFSAGNKSININDGQGHVRIYLFYTDLELIRAFYQIVPFFAEIEDALPDGTPFVITIRLLQGSAEGSAFDITADDIAGFQLP